MIQYDPFDTEKANKINMTQEQITYLLALRKIEGIGPVIAKNLIAYCGGVKEIFEKKTSYLDNIPEVSLKLANLIKTSLDLKVAEKELQYCIDNKIEVLAFTSKNYPEKLKTIHNAPLVLFKKGEYNLNEKRSIAVVGTRTSTEYGKKQTANFVQALIECGVNIVSGLAYGIDIEAHKQAISNKGTTTAVLGHGLNMIYPAQHKNFAAEIIQNGCLITEYLHTAKPDAKNFPERNRIITGMCDATIVVEAPIKSGAMIAAKLAFDQDREVFAVPGNLNSKNSEGCNQLIKDNIAKLVMSPEDVISELELVKEASHKAVYVPKAITTPLSSDEQRILNVLDRQEQQLDQIAQKSAIPVSQSVTLLLTLEFKGYVRQTPGRSFARI